MTKKLVNGDKQMQSKANFSTMRSEIKTFGFSSQVCHGTELIATKCVPRISSIQVASGSSLAVFFVNCLLSKIFLSTVRSLAAGFYLIAVL